MPRTVVAYNIGHEFHHHPTLDSHPECPDRHRFKFSEDLLSLLDPHYLRILSETSDCSQETLINLAADYDSVYFNKGTLTAALAAAQVVSELTGQILDGQYRNGFAIVRPPGHHATFKTPCGFSFINNVAIGVKRALDHGLKKILIVDLDVHHGNGTQEMFYEDDRVLFISLHRYDDGFFWPHLRESAVDHIGAGPGKGFNINLPLRRDDVDSTYQTLFNEIVFPIACQFDPELVFISAGFDCLHADPLGQLNVTASTYSWMVQQLAGLAGGKCLAVLEGGYNWSGTADAIVECIHALLGSFRPRLLPTFEEKLKFWHEYPPIECLLPAKAYLSKYWTCLQNDLQPPIKVRPPAELKAVQKVPHPVENNGRETVQEIDEREGDENVKMPKDDTEVSMPTSPRKETHDVDMLLKDEEETMKMIVEKSPASQHQNSNGIPDPNLESEHKEQEATEMGVAPKKQVTIQGLGPTRPRIPENAGASASGVDPEEAVRPDQTDDSDTEREDEEGYYKVLFRPPGPNNRPPDNVRVRQADQTMRPHEPRQPIFALLHQRKFAGSPMLNQIERKLSTDEADINWADIRDSIEHFDNTDLSSSISEGDKPLSKSIAELFESVLDKLLELSANSPICATFLVTPRTDLSRHLYAAASSSWEKKINVKTDEAIASFGPIHWLSLPGLTTADRCLLWQQICLPAILEKRPKGIMIFAGIGRIFFVHQSQPDSDDTSTLLQMLQTVRRQYINGSTNYLKGEKPSQQFLEIRDQIIKQHNLSAFKVLQKPIKLQHPRSSHAGDPE
ncbi:unnamed protein product, partial [Mesorhabditis spiculigera]